MLTTRGHYPIIFHTTFFHQTFRDYCGIKLLLGHQYGSHYLHLNLKNLYIPKSGAMQWNHLSEDLKNSETLSSFKRKIRQA